MNTRSITIWRRILQYIYTLINNIMWTIFRNNLRKRKRMKQQYSVHEGELCFFSNKKNVVSCDRLVFQILTKTGYTNYWAPFYFFHRISYHSKTMYPSTHTNTHTYSLVFPHSLTWTFPTYSYTQRT